MSQVRPIIGLTEYKYSLLNLERIIEMLLGDGETRTWFRNNERLQWVTPTESDLRKKHKQ
jgi:hypothetical protein